MRGFAKTTQILIDQKSHSSLPHNTNKNIHLYGYWLSRPTIAPRQMQDGRVEIPVDEILLSFPETSTAISIYFCSTEGI